MDVLAVYAATMEAVEQARSGGGPSFLVMETYRFGGHGMSDVDRAYRTRDEEREWQSTRDPIERIRQTLVKDWQTDEDVLRDISLEIAKQVDISAEAAQKASLPLPEELKKHVYAD